MKKTILGIILTLALIVAMVGNVNAASVSVNKTTPIKKGEQVKVTVSTDEGTSGLQFDLTYNDANFKLVRVEGEEGFSLETSPEKVADAKGTVTVMKYTSSTTDTTKKVVLVFEALKDTTKDGKDFVVNGFVSFNGETLEDGTSVNVVVTTPGTTTPDDPKTDDPGTSEPDDPAESDDPSYQQTGAPVYAGIAAVVVVAGAILLVRKVRK